ncbi:hypothetical protein [Pseudomonas fluorescens]|nr:hypothetical protein [Pseudomonas fluorescens]
MLAKNVQTPQIIQTARVIVDVHREQGSLLQGVAYTSQRQVGYKAASLGF